MGHKSFWDSGFRVQYAGAIKPGPNSTWAETQPANHDVPTSMPRPGSDTGTTQPTTHTLQQSDRTPTCNQANNKPRLQLPPYPQLLHQQLSLYSKLPTPPHATRLKAFCSSYRPAPHRCTNHLQCTAGCRHTHMQPGSKASASATALLTAHSFCLQLVH